MINKKIKITMKKKKTIFWVVVAAAVLALIILALSIWAREEKSGMKSSDITAVYMTTGDIYFGKMDWLPWPRLRNVWYIQRGVNADQQPQVSLAQFKEVFWTPIDEIRLNPKEIIFWTMVEEGSEMAEALKDPEAFKQPQQTGSQNTGTPSDSEFKGPSGQPPANQ
jgi:hypothetical protein